MEFLPLGCQDTNLKLLLTKGGQSVEVKKWEVGLNIPNAPSTGEKQTDRAAGLKAPTPVCVACA